MAQFALYAPLSLTQILIEGMCAVAVPSGFPTVAVPLNVEQAAPAALGIHVALVPPA